MFIGYAVVAVVLSIGLAGSAVAKLTRQQPLLDTCTKLGVPHGLLPYLAVCELAGVAGLLIGLWIGPLGIAAAVGVVGYFIGAVGAHVRAKDLKGVPSPLAFLILAVVALALRAATL